MHPRQAAPAAPGARRKAPLSRPGSRLAPTSIPTAVSHPGSASSSAPNSTASGIPSSSTATAGQTRPAANGRSASPHSSAVPDFSNNVSVAVRIRGRSAREVAASSPVVISVDSVKGKSVSITTSNGPREWPFDTVFSSAADQRTVFEDIAPVVDEVVAGYNCTVFAYGQTGTGKTYTMTGEISDALPVPAAAGIIPRALHHLFDRLDTDPDRRDRTVKIGYLELYNEELRDLLADSDGSPLRLFEDRSKGRAAPVVTGQEEAFVDSAGAAIQLLRYGAERRATAATGSNEHSSRSHAVFTITLMRVLDGKESVAISKLHLVDLAGSENVEKSAGEGRRAAEAGLINRSLLAVGRVINALVDGAGHVPYRESKLTRLLQDALGGQSKTVMVATVSPAANAIDESISTLDYAARARNVRNGPVVGAAIAKRVVLREFAAELARVRAELSATRQRNGVYLPVVAFEELTAERESFRVEARDYSARLTVLEDQLVGAERTAQTAKERASAAERRAEEDAAAAREALAEAERRFDSLDGSLRRRATVEASNQRRWAAARAAVTDAAAEVDQLAEQVQTGRDAALKSFRQAVSQAVAAIADGLSAVDSVGSDVGEVVTQAQSDRAAVVAALTEAADVANNAVLALSTGFSTALDTLRQAVVAHAGQVAQAKVNAATAANRMAARSEQHVTAVEERLDAGRARREKISRVLADLSAQLVEDEWEGVAEGVDALATAGADLGVEIEEGWTAVSQGVDQLAVEFDEVAMPEVPTIGLGDAVDLVRDDDGLDAVAGVVQDALSRASDAIRQGQSSVDQLKGLHPDGNSETAKTSWARAAAVLDQVGRVVEGDGDRYVPTGKTPVRPGRRADEDGAESESSQSGSENVREDGVASRTPLVGGKTGENGSGGMAESAVSARSSGSIASVISTIAGVHSGMGRHPALGAVQASSDVGPDGRQRQRSLGGLLRQLSANKTVISEPPTGNVSARPRGRPASTTSVPVSSVGVGTRRKRVLSGAVLQPGNGNRTVGDRREPASGPDTKARRDEMPAGFRPVKRRRENGVGAA